MMNKYRNKEKVLDGIKFKSIKEANRYSELKLMEKERVISNLVLQPEFVLQIAFTDSQGNKHKAIKYRGDFSYYDYEKQRSVIEDVKGFKTKEYKLKKKLLLYAYQDFIFQEV